MNQHSIRPSANYINWIGRTVKQVHEEAALHRSLSDHLAKIVDDVGRENTRALRQRLLSHVELEKHAGRIRLSPPQATPLKWTVRNLLHKIGIPLLLLLLSPLFLLASPYLAWRLRTLERSDPEIVIRPSRDHTARLSVQEDRSITNHFNVLGDVKPGLFRLAALKISAAAARLLGAACLPTRFSDPRQDHPFRALGSVGQQPQALLCQQLRRQPRELHG